MTPDASFNLVGESDALFAGAPPSGRDSSGSESLLSSLLRGSTEKASPAQRDIHGVVVGRLLALTDEGRTPLVRFDGQFAQAAVRARSTVDLQGAHIGEQVVLMFEQGDPASPIVMGVLQGPEAGSREGRSDTVQVEADGDRLIVGARDQLVLRCGKARITLTKAGKVLIEGTYVLSRSSGVNRVKGGSVQLN